MSDDHFNYTIEDRFTVSLENIVDERDNPLNFPITIRVESNGHGDTLTQLLEYEIRLAVYDAVDEFDERYTDE